MPIRSAITMAGVGTSPPRSRAAAEALIATRDDSNKPGKDGRMSAKLRATHVPENVNVGSLCTARRPRPRRAYCPRSRPELTDFLPLSRGPRLEALCHRWPWPIPAGKRPTSVDRPQTVRSRIGELHEKSSLFIRPSRCEKVAAACQRLLLSHSAALPCKLCDQRDCS